MVSDELDEVAEAYGTPRRTVLTGAVARPSRSAANSAASLEVADTPCTVLLSVTGRALRLDRDPDALETSRAPSRATKHGAVLAAVDGSVRGELGAIMSDGTLHRFTPVDLPLVPAASIAFSAGVPLTAYIGVTDKKTEGRRPRTFGERHSRWPVHGTGNRETSRAYRVAPSTRVRDYWAKKWRQSGRCVLGTR